MDEAEILSGLRAGSSEAHEALYDTYADGLYDYCYALLQDDTAAGAVLRETLLHVAASSDALPDGCSLRAWLYALARGKCRAGGDRMIEHPVPAGDPSALLLITVLGALTARDREILELIGRHGLSTIELEPILGLPPEKVGSLVAEARSRFDQAMTTELDRTGPVEYPPLTAITEGGDALVLLFQAVPYATPSEDQRPGILEALLAGGTGTATDADAEADADAKAEAVASDADAAAASEPEAAIAGGEDVSAALASSGAVPAVAAALGSEVLADDADALAASGHPTDEIPVVGGGDAPRRKRGLLVGAVAAVVLVAGLVFGLTQLRGSPQPNHRTAAVPSAPVPTSATPTRPPSSAPRGHLVGHDAAPSESASPSPSKSGYTGGRHHSRTGSHGTGLSSSSSPSSPPNSGGGSTTTTPAWPPHTPPPGHKHPPGGGPHKSKSPSSSPTQTSPTPNATTSG